MNKLLALLLVLMTVSSLPASAALVYITSGAEAKRLVYFTNNEEEAHAKVFITRDKKKARGCVISFTGDLAEADESWQLVAEAHEADLIVFRVGSPRLVGGKCFGP